LVTFNVVRFEVPVTFMAPPKSETAFITKAFPLVKTFRVAMFAWVRTVMLVALAVATFRVVTLVVERFEVPVMFMSRPKSETAFITKAFPLVKTFRVAMFAWVRTVMLVALAVATFRVVTFVVERLEIPVMFMSPPKSDAAFMTKAFPLVKTFRVAMFAWVRTVMLVALAVATFRVVTFVVERLEVPVMFMSRPKSETAFITKAFPLVKTFRVAMFAWVPTVMLIALAVVRFEVPVTFMFVPKIEATLRVVTLVVERFEVPVMFMFVPSREVALRVAAFVL